MLYCYECNDWVICDTSRGEIALIRSALDALQDQVIPASRTRAGSVIRMSQPVFQFVDKTEALDMKDRMFTIKKHYEQVLCRRALRAWSSVVRTPDASETLDDELRQFHGRTGLRNIGNTCYQNATLTSLSCLGVFRELVRRLPELHRVGGPASSRQWYMLAMLPMSRRPSEDIYAEAQTKPKRLNRRARQKAAFDAHKSSDSNKQNEAESGVSVLLQLHNLLRVLWSGKWAGVTPMSFVKTFVARVPQFRGYRQHDAHEFLMALLDQIHSELRELPADSRYSQIQSTGGVLPAQPRPSLRLFVQKHFQSVQVSRTRCHRCRVVSKYVFPGAHAITLDIAYTLERLAQERKTRTPSDGEPRRSCRSSSAAAKLLLQEQMGRHSTISCSLMDLLRDLVAPTRLTGNCLYRCNTCQDLTEATKVDSFDFLSSVIVFHLNRTQWNSRGKSKITQRISFPLNKLDLSLLAISNPTDPKPEQAREAGEGLSPSLHSSPTLLARKRRRSKSASLVYNLRAMVVHHGKQIDEGHYTSICYSDSVQEWVAFNDLKAEIVSEANVLQHEGHDYLLFYERVVE